MEKSRFRIAVRCRPLVRKERKSGTKWAEFDCNKTDKKITVEGAEFEFDHVFGYEDEQDVVYNISVKQLIANVMQGGRNVAVLAYGQTNSGKTYTMGMDHNMYKEMEFVNDTHGIVPRVLQDIFPYIFNSAEICTKVNISFLEVYNDKIYDLLSEELERRPLQMIEEGNKPKDINQKEVTSFNEALKLLVDGSMKRSTTSSGKNVISSRSHAAFTIQIKKKIGCAELISQIMLVDLAGSEAPSKMGSMGETFNEGCRINSSLLALHGVVQALEAKGPSVHVPYRNSTLTRLLKPYLEGDGQTLMIACITPTIDSLTTLKFAAKVKQVKYKLNEPSTVRKRLYDTPWQTNKKTSVHTLSRATVLPQPQFTKTPHVQLSLLKADETLTGNDTVVEVQGKNVKDENTPFCFLTPAVPKPSGHLPNRDSPNRVYLQELLSLVQNMKPKSCERTNKVCLNTPDRRVFNKVAKEVAKLRKSMAICASSQRLMQETTAIANSSNESLSADEFDDFNEVPVPPKPEIVDECKPLVNRRSARISVLREQNYKVTNETASFAEKPSNVKKRTSIKYRNPECCPMWYGLQNKHLWCKPCGEKKKCILKIGKGRSRSKVCNSIPTMTQDDTILDILNSGNLKMLQSVPCIGPKSAMIIRNWVHIKGKLNSVTDLKDVSSLPKAFYARFTKANLC